MKSMNRLLAIIVAAIAVGCTGSVAYVYAAPASEGTVLVESCDYEPGGLEDCDDAAFLVGTVVRSTTSPSPLKVVRYTLTWTSSAGGAVSANPFTVTHGNLLQVKIKPAAGGSAPTTLYDVTLVDEDSLDYLSGRGTDMSATLPLMLQWDPPVMWHTSQQMDLVVANAGAAKSGTVVLWVRAQ
jgi:hypothetical protein